jgi:glyoxylase-like metal-dependent hydrolase (beta-lactamase superfamily II)
MDTKEQIKTTNVVVQPLPISSGSNTDAFIYPTLIQTAHELVLVDTGYPGQADVIFSVAAQQGYDLNKLTRIVLTHHDFDHVGSLQEIKRRCPQARVIAAAKEAAFISGRKKAFRLQQAEAVFESLQEAEKAGAKAFQAFLETIVPCAVDATVRDGDWIDRDRHIRVVETPGHTEGHISLLIVDTKTWITGDALVYEEGLLKLANPEYAFDLSLARESAKKIQAEEPATIVCYHGGVCSQPAPEQYTIG